MTEIKIEMSFDVSDKNKNEAFRQFLKDFADEAPVNPAEQLQEVKTLEDDASVKEAASKKEEVPAKKRRTKAEIEAEEKAAETPKEEPKKETPKEEAKATKEEPKEEPKEEAEKTEGSAVTLSQVRALLSEKVKAHKITLKKKLSSLDGATSVSVLDEKHYAEFYEFMQGLD